MNQSPKISVIMPVYNESIHDLRESINSILNQTYRNFEYIIVDDNPKSLKIKRFLLCQSDKDNRIRLIFNSKENLGVIKSSNKGINYANGEFINRMDADDIAHRNKLQIQLYFLLRYNLDMVCSNFSVINSIDQMTRKYGYNSKSTIINQNKIKQILKHCNIAMGPTLFFKKSCFSRIHGYRETNVEDYDLASRFLIQGYRVGYINRPLINKRLHKHSISYNTILSQYVIMKSISKFLRNNNFKNVLPLYIIKYNLSNISSRQKNKFYKFVDSRYSYNDSPTIKSFGYMMFSIISSLTSIKWCMWALKNKIYR